ncbi:hypothetical protein [Streptomyces sp. TS71-3]|uniref:hypothetical protein n=1 Tax=Streptomyces sp. TS71-3 TaxID=2733862 RepID=UPI001B114AE8|nr:hypothetical protein [Streptomyces sp. TS71-3]GHJ37589.1 hypothetical protein Sm713_31980 [Streptomyces sp. TS71-3]
MLTVDQLRNLRLGQLKTAVDDWKHMVGKLKELNDGGGGGGGVTAQGLKARTGAANWNGVNATVGKEFVTKTASQFDDAVVEAEGVHALLSDAHSRFTKHKKDLNDTIDDLAKRDITVNGKGRVSSAAPSGAAAGDVKPPTREALDAAQARIDKIMDAADEDDRVIARALRAYARNKYDFSDHAVKGAADAEKQQGKQDAKYWTDRIKKGDVAKWSDADVARFNEVLKEQKDNPAFAEAFATGLGADGTLQFWRDLAAPPGGALDGERARILAHVQDNLSMTLASATHSHSPAMEQWKHDVIAAGDKTFPVDPRMPAGPKGFQIMSSLMGKGTFDGKFLDDYGKSLLTYERGIRGGPEALWFDTTNLNYPPTDDINDPVPGFLEALGHNPEESVAFFDESSGDGGDRMSNFDYLVGGGDGSREWPKNDDGEKWGQRSLGHALEAATEGVPYGSDAKHPPHSEESAALVHRLVEEFGGATDRLEGSELRPSLGRITADYMRDVQGGINGSGGVHVETYGVDADLGGIDGHGLGRFLGYVGKDPDAYGAIINAQQAVTTELVNDAFRDGGYDDITEEVQNRVDPGSGIAGILAESRTKAIYDERIASDEEFNDGITKMNDLAGQAIGYGVSQIPVGGDVASQVIDKVRGAVVDHYAQDHSAEAHRDREDFLENQQRSSVDAVHDAVYTAAVNAGVDSKNAESQAEAAARQVRDTYNQGRQSGG